MPLLAEALGTGEKQPAGPMVKIKRAKPKKEKPNYSTYVCLGCGYEYDPAVGDEDGDVVPGTLFDKLPEEWVCPECSEEKASFIEVKP